MATGTSGGLGLGPIFPRLSGSSFSLAAWLAPGIVITTVALDLGGSATPFTDCCANGITFKLAARSLASTTH
jgi:hypothetical protein